MTPTEFDNFIAHVENPVDLGLELIDTFSGAFEEPLPVPHAALLSIILASYGSITNQPPDVALVALLNAVARAAYNMGRLADVPATLHS